MGDTPAGVTRLERPEDTGGGICDDAALIAQSIARLSASPCFLTGTVQRSTVMLRAGSGRTPLTTLLLRYS